MKVYTANYYDWDNNKFLGVFSTSEKAIEVLKEFYEENKGMKCGYVVAEVTLDKGTEDSISTSLDEIEIYGNKFEN